MAHLQRAEALLDTCKLEAAFDADAAQRMRPATCARWAREGGGGLCRGARRTRPSSLLIRFWKRRLSSTVDGEPVVQGRGAGAIYV